MGAAISCELLAMASVTPPAAPREGFVKNVWLLLYAEGGWWPAAEIRQRLRLSGDFHASLREMVDRGFIERKKITTIDGETAVNYGVMRRCKVPRGVTVDEMWVVLQMGSKG